MRRVLLVLLLLALLVELAAVLVFNQGHEEDSQPPRIVPQPETVLNTTPPGQTGIDLGEYNRIGEATRAAAYRPDVPNRPLGDLTVHVRARTEAGPAAGVVIRIDQRSLDTPRRLRNFDQEAFWIDKTDSEGTAVFSTLPPGRFIVRAMDEDAFAMTAVVLSAGQDVVEVPLALAPTSGLTGLVRTEDGAPATDVRVFALDPSLGEEAPANLLFAFPAQTDENGRFWFPQFPAPARLIAWREGYALAVSDYLLPATDSTVLILGPGQTLEGQFILGDAAKPLANVRVNLSDDLGLAPEAAISDADGRFVFERLRPVEYTLQVSSRDFALQEPAQTLVVHAGQGQQLTIPLERTGHLRGRMLEASGEAGVAGVEIEAISDARGKFSVATDHGGYFFFEGLPAGTYTLRAPEGAGYGVLNGELLSEPFSVKPAEQTAGPLLRVQRK